MAVIIGSARIDENGHSHSGSAGDQTGREVSTQSFYVHKKGWYVLRAKSAEIANKMAEAMKRACANNNIGYDQYNRLGVIEHGTGSTVKTECDCSSLVRQCVIEASGKDPGNFNTSNEVSALENTGLFEPKKSYVSSMTLYTGDILVTKTKGHTVIVTDGAKRTDYTVAKPSISDTAKNVLNGKYGNGQDRIDRLKKLGYTDTEIKEIQAKVNEMVKPASKPKPTTKPTPKPTPASHFKVGSTYTTQVSDLNVRTGAGTGYRKKSRSELTADGRKHADSEGQFKKGTRVTCKEVKTVGSQVWIRTPSGWLCAYNGSKYYVK